MAAPTTTVVVTSCVFPTLEAMCVNVARVTTVSVSLPVIVCLTVLLDRSPALTAQSVSAAASSATDKWTVQTSQMNKNVSF